MTMEELGNKLVEWTDQYGWGKESLNNFANINATSSMRNIMQYGSCCRI